MAFKVIHKLALERLGAWKKQPVTRQERPGWEAIRFPTAENGSLAGLYGRASRLPYKGTVVLAPPALEAKEFFLRYDYARALREVGYHVLLFDFNGTGESEQQGFYYEKDVLAAGEEACRRAPDLPVGLLGVCFGAVYGIRALAQARHPFTVLLAEAPYTSASAFLSNVAAHRGRPTRLQRAVVNRILPYYPGTRVIDEIHRVRDVQSMLFVYGEKDIYAPPRMGRQFTVAHHAKRQSDVEAPVCTLCEVPEAGHLGLFEDAPQYYREQIIGFFDRTLACSAPDPSPLQSVPVVARA